jgi:hypothetical protein
LEERQLDMLEVGGSKPSPPTKSCLAARLRSDLIRLTQSACRVAQLVGGLSTGDDISARPQQSSREGLADAGEGVGGRPPRFSDASAAYVVSAILLGSAFVALLWVPSYAHLTPDLGGIPFFYWYSILWLLINAACQGIAYMLLFAAPRRRRILAQGGVAPATRPTEKP